MAILGYINPNFNEKGQRKHGHLATFSVGTNRAKGQIANIGSTNGFLGISKDDGTKHIFSADAASQVQYFILAPFVTPKSLASFGPFSTSQ